MIILSLINLSHESGAALGEGDMREEI